MRGGHPLHRATVCEDVDHAIVGEDAHGELGDVVERGGVVERRGEKGARFGEGSPVRHLDGPLELVWRRRGWELRWTTSEEAWVAAAVIAASPAPYIWPGVAAPAGCSGIPRLCALRHVCNPAAKTG